MIFYVAKQYSISRYFDPHEVPSAIELGYNRNSCLDFLSCPFFTEFSERTDSCLICSEPLSVGESCQIGSKGLASLVKVSQLLHDGLEAQFSSKPELVLHTNCRKKYTRPSNIKAAEKSSDKHLSPRTAEQDVPWTKSLILKLTVSFVVRMPPWASN